MSESRWYGDESDGIELRYHENGLDEVILYIGGKCVAHVEQMSDTHYWMSLQSEKYEVHVNISSKNGQSHVVATADGWSKS